MRERPYIVGVYLLLSATALGAALIALPDPSRAQHGDANPTPRLDLAQSATSGSIVAILRLASDAEHLFVAEVVEVQPSPGFWTGTVKAVQRVRYRVVDTLGGDADWSPGASLQVDFLIIERSPWVQENQPKLRADLFRPGARHVVFVLPRNYFAADGLTWAFVGEDASIVVLESEPPSP
jgi:hypothetical protein